MIQELEQQVKSQAQKQSTIPSTDNTETHIQKTVNTAENLDKGPTPNINEMLKFIESTMQTLNAFTKQLTQQQGTSQTHSGM